MQIRVPNRFTVYIYRLEIDGKKIAIRKRRMLGELKRVERTWDVLSAVGQEMLDALR